MSEMSPKGAVTTVIATIMMAARMLAAPETVVPVDICFDEAEAIVAEAEKRYGTIPNDPD
jgi:hypothetical protein